jgi:hypothetical protein
MSCLICNELLHDTITCGLILYVSHINTISPPKVVTQLLKKTRTFQTTSAERHLKRFTERVTKTRQPPLLELPGDEAAIGGRAPLSLPMQSRRIAAQTTAHIPTAKWGEYLVTKRLGLSSGMPPSSTSAMTYDEVFNGDPDHLQVLCELFPPVGDRSGASIRQLGHRPPC